MSRLALLDHTHTACGVGAGAMQRPALLRCLGAMVEGGGEAAAARLLQTYGLLDVLWQHLSCRESEVLGAATSILTRATLALATNTPATNTPATNTPGYQYSGYQYSGHQYWPRHEARRSDAYGCSPEVQHCSLEHLRLQVLGAALDALRRVASSSHGLEAVASRAAG